MSTPTQKPPKIPYVNPMEVPHASQDRKPAIEKLLEGFTKLPENLIGSAMNYTPIDTSSKEHPAQQDFEGDAQKMKAARERIEAVRAESQSARRFLDERNKNRLDGIEKEKEERYKAMSQSVPDEEPTGKQARGKMGGKRLKAQVPTMENKVNKGKG